MTSVSLACAVCENTITSDPCTPHDRDCVTLDGCRCNNVVCPGCCWTCNEPFSDSPRDSGTSDAPGGLRTPGATPAAGERAGPATAELPAVDSSRSPEVGTTQPSPRALAGRTEPGRGRADTTNEQATAPLPRPVA